MCQNVCSYIDLHAMRMRKCDAFFHVLHRKVFCFRPKSEDLAADVYGICAKDNGYF